MKKTFLYSPNQTKEHLCLNIPKEQVISIPGKHRPLLAPTGINIIWKNSVTLHRMSTQVMSGFRSLI